MDHAVMRSANESKKAIKARVSNQYNELVSSSTLSLEQQLAIVDAKCAAATKA